MQCHLTHSAARICQSVEREEQGRKTHTQISCYSCSFSSVAHAHVLTGSTSGQQTVLTRTTRCLPTLASVLPRAPFVLFPRKKKKSLKNLKKMTHPAECALSFEQLIAKYFIIIILLLKLLTTKRKLRYKVPTSAEVRL